MSCKVYYFGDIILSACKKYVILSLINTSLQEFAIIYRIILELRSKVKERWFCSHSKKAL